MTPQAGHTLREIGGLPGRLPENIIHFGRALRKAGVAVGPAQARSAIEAVAAAGFTSREDFRAALRASMVSRAADLAVFEQVFALFWRDPDLLDRMIRLMLQPVRAPRPEPEAHPARRRAEDALGAPAAAPQEVRAREAVEMEMRFTLSERERLARKDFEQMTAAELAEAEAALRALSLDPDPLRTRRRRRRPHGPAVDMRASMLRAMRRGGELDRPVRRTPRTRPPDLVAICDISGSMSVYSRMLLRFLHALAHDRARRFGRVRAFTFSTRLTNVSRALAQADPDRALAAVGQQAPDWQGGTRIGEALRAFNRDWSRRVLGQGAVVLLITDGLERGEPELLSTEAARLARSCRRLIWLNPLLRYEGFAPQARGIKALLPHVHGFHACHSLDSLAALAAAFAEDHRGRGLRLMREI